MNFVPLFYLVFLCFLFVQLLSVHNFVDFFFSLNFYLCIFHQPAKICSKVCSEFKEVLSSN